VLAEVLAQGSPFQSLEQQPAVSKVFINRNNQSRGGDQPRPLVKEKRRNGSSNLVYTAS
jgi:hypothetical protein